MMETWNGYLDQIVKGLQAVAVTDRQMVALPPADGLARWVEMTHAMSERGGCLFFIGNGGSAGMASHMAADACKNGRLRALALTDPALLTATSNDLSFEQTFSLPLERLARPGDQLIAISSSGESPNIVRAIESARALGVETITLSGKQPGNRARTLGDLNFYVPLTRYGWAESAHQVLLHYWFDQYLNAYGQGVV
jgi:D-sedoheptulose 7-phosphate isomerase